MLKEMAAALGSLAKAVHVLDTRVNNLSIKLDTFAPSVPMASRLASLPESSAAMCLQAAARGLLACQQGRALRQGQQERAAAQR
nr:unnamed protein product [Digitaria exilis]